MRKHLPFLVFYISFLFTGFLIFDDYGVSWDESECRLDNGIRNIDFILSGDEKPLLESISKYHGAAFEMTLVVVEKIFNIQSTRNIFLSRHLVTFLLFAAAVVFFYGICLRTFKSKWYGLLGVAMLVLCPRIFADAFYNSKDLPFLSFLIISIYFLQRFLEDKKYIHAVLCGLSMGYMIDIRIMGIILPAAMLFLLIVDFILHPENRKKIVLATLIFGLTIVTTIILFWPVLWLGPVKHFLLAWKELSRYPWDGNVLYDGEIFKSIDLPWHYPVKWMLITIPPLYIMFFIIGLVVVLKKMVTNKRLSSIDFILLWLFFIPLISVWLLDSVLYDGWRHLYFVFPAMVLTGITGFKSVIELISFRRAQIVIASVVAYFSTVLISMAELHPFENVYFNVFASANSVPVKDRYEVEYWALSYRQAMEHILKTDSSNDILLFTAEGQPGMDNLNFLDVESQERLSITENRELADYYLTIHRKDRNYSYYEPAFHIMRHNLIIHSIYDLRKNRIALSENNLIKKFSNNFESDNEQFHPFHILSDPNTGNKFERMEEKDDFGVNLSFTVDSSLLTNDRKYYAEFKMKFLSEENSRLGLIFQIDESSFWKQIDIQCPKQNRWNEYRFVQEMPEFKAVGNIIKIHLANPNHQQVDIDDIEVNIYCFPIDEVKNAIMKFPS